METKYFRSKYNHFHADVWEDTIKELGINVYDVIVPCELGVILGGFYENPAAFTDKLSLVFYRRETESYNVVHTNLSEEEQIENDKYRHNDIASTLKHYFDELVDLTGLSPKESAEKIRSTVETYQ